MPRVMLSVSRHVLRCSVRTWYMTHFTPQSGGYFYCWVMHNALPDFMHKCRPPTWSKSVFFRGNKKWFQFWLFGKTMGSKKKNIFLAIFTHDVVLSSVWLSWNAVGREPTERECFCFLRILLFLSTDCIHWTTWCHLPILRFYSMWIIDLTRNYSNQLTVWHVLQVSWYRLWTWLLWGLANVAS